jgi:hypothetical protein
VGSHCCFSIFSFIFVILYIWKSAYSIAASSTVLCSWRKTKF